MDYRVINVDAQIPCPGNAGTCHVDCPGRDLVFKACRFGFQIRIEGENRFPGAGCPWDEDAEPRRKRVDRLDLWLEEHDDQVVFYNNSGAAPTCALVAVSPQEKQAFISGFEFCLETRRF